MDDKTQYTDWSQRNDIKAALKVDLILALAKHGYPPVANNEVYKDILEQAENFKKYRLQHKANQGSTTLLETSEHPVSLYPLSHFLSFDSNVLKERC